MEPLEAGEPQRLHPLTLIYRALASLPGLLLLIVPAIQNPDAGTVAYIIIGALYGIFALPWIFLYYHRFRYQITPKEVVIVSGVLTRKQRNIPVERVLNVEIQQRMLSRLMGLASVAIETAGSSSADAQIDYVSLKQARHIRHVIRDFQKKGTPTPQDVSLPSQGFSEAEHSLAATETNVLHAMSPTAVIQFGAFKFSLVYIAIIFGGLQFFGFLEADTLERFFEQRPDQLALLQALPLWIIITTVALTSMLIGWLTGILVTFNRYFNFKLWMEGDKLQKRHGLLTLSEGTIPLRKVQILILKANVPMRFFRRFGLELQTMGLDPSQSGRRVAVPMAHLSELIQLIPSVFPEFRMPDRFEPVSKLTIRRMSIRYSLMTLLVLAPVIYFWNPAGWALIALPMVYPLALLQYRHHGYCVDGDTLYVKRGVWQHYLWIVPVDKIQTLHTSQSIFQRRLGLATLHVDTAGSASTNYPQTLDLTLETAQELMESLYAHFQTLFESGKATRTGILPSEKVPDEPDSRQG